MKILAIETSCDETAVAILEILEKKTFTEVNILGNGLLSQTGIHALLGGVVPSLAKREHANNLIPMLTVALLEAKWLQPKISKNNFDKKTENTLKKLFSHEPDLFEAFIEFIPTIQKPKIDVIAVTAGPGLEPALWVGINFAKALSFVFNKLVIPINHMEGHILSSLLIQKSGDNFILEKPQFPMLSLLISGGHTELVLAKKSGSYKIIGETRDDAVGEAFDKVARMLSFPYPGGPHVSKLAEAARKEKIVSEYPLPRPMLRSDDFNFSFAGLKTAVLYTLKKTGEITEDIKMQIAREFEDAVTEVLVTKTRKALKKTGAKTLAVGGGVIANKNIRVKIDKMISREFPDVKLYLPTPNLTTDNAVMIGLAGYFRSKDKKLSTKKIVANGSWRLE